MSPRSPHYAVRRIAYQCPEHHTVEYYHARHHCNRTIYMQNYPCANEPRPTDNPEQVRATHYRLTSDSLDDSNGIKGVEFGCPVCEREVQEAKWMAGWVNLEDADTNRFPKFPSSLMDRPSSSHSDANGMSGAGEEGVRMAGSEQHDGGNRTNLSIPGKETGERAVKKEQNSGGYQPNSWIFEMPFVPIWKVQDGEMVDVRPYRFMLPGVPYNRHGERWPRGEYKGMNHSGWRDGL